MSGDVKVLGLVGRLRRGSVNLQLLDAVRAGPPNGLVIDRFDRLKDIPPFDEDDEDAVPNAVDELRARIRGAPAVLIATPETLSMFTSICCVAALCCSLAAAI